MKGLDWEGLTARYGSLATRTTTSQAFNRIANLMFGELDGSHLGMSGGSSYSAPSDRTGYLGVELEPVETGYRITRVLPGGPAAGGPRALGVDDVVTAVEGRALVGDDGVHMDWRAALKDTSGEEVLFDVTRADGTAERLIVRTTSWGAIRNLRYEDEVRQRRAIVEELSDGRLGYLHIRGMSMPSVRDFERDLYAAAHGKDGLVIDVRDNGGGSTTDILLASLTAPRHAFTVPRGADYDSVPRDAYPRDRRLIYGYSRPIIVLINENSFSNAEIFAHSIRNTNRGRLVGEATFGGVISTGAASLIDGTRIRMPFRGWYLPDETDMENNGAVPDVFVPRLPGDEHAGVDAQLERAVTELLSDIDG
jgi:tricorn protease